MNDIVSLTSTKDELRDEEWEDQFLQAFTNSGVLLLDEAPQTGPDGWPYLLMETAISSSEPTQKVLGWLATRGIGAVINPKKTFPDFILTYGMIWNFRETGRFIDRRIEQKSSEIEYEINHLRPLGRELPDYVRKVIREFFRDQAILSPRMASIGAEGSDDLAISLESLNNPPAHERAGIAEAIGWFLPTHYSITFGSEKAGGIYQNL